MKSTRRIDEPPFSAITARWRTVPHLSDLAIAAFHVATDGLAAELTANQFKASLGVSPRTGISGSIDKSRNSKSGYRPAKDAIFMTVQTMLNPKNNKLSKNRIKHFYDSGHKAAHCRRKLASILSGIARNPQGQWK